MLPVHPKLYYNRDTALKNTEAPMTETASQSSGPLL